MYMFFNFKFRPVLQFNRPPVQSGSVLQGGGAYGGVNRVSAFEAFHNCNRFLTPVQLQVCVYVF